MEKIQVGSIIILNFDLYWKYKQEIPKLEDMIARGFGEQEYTLDTPFSQSCGDNKSHSSKEFLDDIKEAVRIFEERYPRFEDEIIRLNHDYLDKKRHDKITSELRKSFS